ncbi:hypothetical protein [Azohydromonas lata]|uniref:Uncharacterized protein n=1 Tax=Azohydromonas lata TaxID=45677 RepID=A0ABU5I817_9BURK|nr:hypothetical protein [Azohydromonas lata]MDZ5455246.1 hypothetical protein [Azohydromonas lata]
MSTRGQRGRYENCELVYRYGPALRDDPRHTGFSWNGFESETYTD